MNYFSYYEPAIPATKSNRLNTAKKIVSFQTLPNGWHFGSGTAASGAEVERALFVLNDILSLGFTSTDAFPGEDGEIAVTAYVREHTIEVIAEVDGSYTFARDDGVQESERQDHIQLPELKRRLASASRDIWNLPASYTRDTLISTNAVSKVSRSGILQEVAYPSSRWSVLRTPEQKSVHIVCNTMAA